MPTKVKLTETPYIPISCDRHDYLEIACLRQYEVKLELIDNRYLTGTPITTETHADKSEWLILALSDQQENECRRTDNIKGINTADVPAAPPRVEQVRQDRIRAITPLSPTAEFQRVLISDNVDAAGSLNN